MSDFGEEVPTEYNEFVQFTEQNDNGVIAECMCNQYTPKFKIEEILEDAEDAAEYAEELGYWREHDGIMHLVDELRSEMYD